MSWNHVIPGHENKQQEEGNHEVDESCDAGGDGHDKAREINFGDEILIVDEAVAGVGERSGKQQPANRAAEIEYGRLDTVGGEAIVGEEQRENDHLGKWLNDSPQNSEDGLFVADLNVAFGENPEEFAVVPELDEIDGLPAGFGAELELTRRGSGGYGSSGQGKFAFDIVTACGDDGQSSKQR